MSFDGAETWLLGVPRTVAIDALLVIVIAVVLYLFYAVINPEKF
jgi:K+-transporting ATPase KdpF subunit